MRAVGMLTEYHHSEASLMGTIINLVQDYVGSNNINLLQPIGQFGTRLGGGHDFANARYIFTRLSDETKFIFKPEDEPLLKHLSENRRLIEPEMYLPIIPMALVNGENGVATGFKTQIPNYDPKDIVKNLKLMIKRKKPTPMKPHFKNFKGDIVEEEPLKFFSQGIINKIDAESTDETKVYEISELPIGRGTEDYKLKVMEKFMEAPVQITDYKEYHTEKIHTYTNSKFQVQDSDLAHFMEDAIKMKKFLRLSHLLRF